MHPSRSLAKSDSKFMLFELNACKQQNRHAFVVAYREGHCSAKRDRSIQIKFTKVRNLRLTCSSVLVDNVESVSLVKMTSSLRSCQQHCPNQKGRRSRNLHLARWFFRVSGSTASFLMGLGVPAAIGIPVEPVNSPLPQLRVISPHETGKEIRSITLDRENSAGTQAKRITLLSEEKAAIAHLSVEVTSEALAGMRSPFSIFPACPPASLSGCGENNFESGANPINPPGVSFWAADLSMPEREISIDLARFDSNRPIRGLTMGTDKLSDVPQLISQENEQQPTQSGEEESESSETEGDPDLGRLRLRQSKAPTRQPQPVLHVLPRISYFYTDNVFSGIDPVEDSLYVPSLTIWSTPKLGPRTYLTASVDGNLIRYLNQSEFDYNLLRFRTGIYQQLNSRMAGEIGWNNQQYFRASSGDRFLSEHFIYLTLSRRDWLNRRLAFDSLYDVRLSFADPDDRSRLINYLSLSLSYYLQRNWQIGLDYQFTFADFTKRDRDDYYHRMLGRLTYGIDRDSQINFQGGVTVGDSTDSNIDFDSLFFSVTYSVDWKVF